MKMVKFFALLAVVALIPAAASAQLVITGVFDGPLPYGVPKVVELYACADIADLSIYGLGCANNGGGTDGVEFTFPADAVVGGTFLYVEAFTSNNATAFFDYFGFEADYNGGMAAGTNGDDAIELFLLTGAEPLCVDVVGDRDVDGSGTTWEYLDGWVKRVTGTGPDGDTFVESNWTYSGPNATDGCTDNGTCASVFPLGGYACNPSVPVDETSFGTIKAMYR